ncbi:MAG: N-acetyltransferase [Hyphomicrobiaceae bacterium]|nr:N-acetyltransferase [Hyphomicrobiaceae bacterium]
MSTSQDLTIRPVRPEDLPAVSALHRAAFGPGRFARTAYRVREGTPAITPHCRAAMLGTRLVAVLRFTEIRIGGKAGALLLGPVAIDPAVAGKGYGRALIARAIDDARVAGNKLVLLVGDLPYYGRFGFTPVPHGQIALPGPVNPARLLALELVPQALTEFRGVVTADRS